MGKKPSRIRWGISFQGPWINRTIFFPWTHTSHLPVPPCSVEAEALHLTLFFSILLLKIYTSFLLFLLHSAKSLRFVPDAWWPLITQGPSPFPFQSHLTLEPGITRATKATAGWPEPWLVPEFFWRKKGEAGVDSASAVRIHTPSLGFYISF